MVTLATALRATDGTPFSAPLPASFRTEQFRVVATGPADGDDQVPRRQNIYVLCSANIDPTSIAGAFSISPAVTGTVQPEGFREFLFIPNTDFAARTAYTIQISSQLRSQSGAQALPFVAQFRTN